MSAPANSKKPASYGSMTREQRLVENQIYGLLMAALTLAKDYELVDTRLNIEALAIKIKGQRRNEAGQVMRKAISAGGPET